MAEQEVYNRIPADDLTQVYLDVGTKTPPEKSKVKYTDDMKAVREDIEDWFSELPEGAVAEFPKL